MDDIGFFFNYKNIVYQLPVNPEELVVTYAGNNESKTIVGLGEISLIQKPKLATLTIESWLPEQAWFPGLRTAGSFQTGQVYEDLFRGVMESEDFMRLIITGVNINMLVTVEDYESKHQAGDHEDIYYTLELKQYKDYSVSQIPVSADNLAVTVRNVFALGSGSISNTGTLVGTPTQITIGSLVLVTGELHSTSAATPHDNIVGNLGTQLLNYSGRVSHIREGAAYPYHVTDTSGNWLGWVSASSVTLQ